LSADLNAGTTILGYLNVPSTGGWQNWTTISHTVSVNAGTYSLGVYAQAGGWNLNWIRVSQVSAAAVSSKTPVKAQAQAALMNDLPSGFVLYPNPARSLLNIRTGKDLSTGIVTIYDMQGRQVRRVKGSSTSIDVSSLTPGIYTLVFSSKDDTIIRQFLR
jgi:hypothetical protein